MLQEMQELKRQQMETQQKMLEQMDAQHQELLKLLGKDSSAAKNGKKRRKVNHGS